MSPSRKPRLRAACERSVDLACAFAGIVLLSPLLGAIALLILCNDGRPVLFTQLRVGLNGKLFIIWKFRTMRAGVPGRAITAAGDRRLTRVGAFLREFKLDELPQLLNVLKGDMSLIGPRPEVPEYVRYDHPQWMAVLQVKPGITDLATLLHRNEEEILGASADPNTFYRDSVLPAKLRLNLAYLRSRSLWRDLKLIFLTIRYSLFPDQFDAEQVMKAFGIGAGIHDGEYLHSLSCPLNR
jgi:lipopolysaccharide/colanic/teichoic acid biosynthesis glycosyltransferase